MNATGWSRGLEVTAGGTGVVSHAGLVLLRELADRTGLTAALPSPQDGHDRGRVFADLACAIADEARVISDFRVMDDQRELFGPAASVPTAWRALKEAASGGDRPDARSPPRRACGVSELGHCAGLRFYAARSYSLMRPPRIGRRWIRSQERSATGWSGRGGRSWRLRWGRRPL